MIDLITFVGLMLASITLLIIYRLRGHYWREYFATKQGKGILKGIILAPAAILAIAAVIWVLSALFSQANAQGRWFRDAGVFVGLDSTFKQSPQCVTNNIDQRTTSNLGAWVNVWQSTSDRVQVNLKYTHHSCALGVDRNGYDAVGVELRWTVWKR